MTSSLAKQMKTALPDPARAIGDISWPSISLIGVYASLIAALYVLIGMNPTPVVWQFLSACAIAVIPVVAPVLTIWFVYSIAYALAVYSTSVEFLITARDAMIPAILDAARRLVQSRYTSLNLTPRLTGSLRGSTNAGLPDSLSVGWHPGASPHLA